jgi:colanic acid biosynthesis protein WcaH
MTLAPEQFKAIVRDTVLVALDLLIVNKQDELLVGRRLRKPAKDYLFVPGGRVLKGETLAAALQRIAKQETGLDLLPEQVELHGIYDHNYSESCFEDADISTQYVVIACRCVVPVDSVIVSDHQHEGLHFMPIADVSVDPRTHPYVKNYFDDHAENRFLGISKVQNATSALNRVVEDPLISPKR